MSKKFKYPYVITVPGYIEASLGIQVVHKLCHLINENGGEAYIVSPETNPEWNTPQLTSGQFNEYKKSGEAFIAVYPEIESGNPLEAPVCVRYMLNREGVLNGNSINAGEDDLFFFYRKEFAENEVNINLLTITTCDLTVFCNDVEEKDIDFLYLNRVPKKVVNFSELPENISILSMENPLSLNELAKVLKRGRVLYSYEASGTCSLAALCGCPVVAMVAPGYEKYAITEKTLPDIGGGGIAWCDTPDEIENARKTAYKVRDSYLELETVLKNQLAEFFSLTQTHAENYATKHAEENIKHWLECRKIIDSEKVEFIGKNVSFSKKKSLLIYVYDCSKDDAAICKTLRSLSTIYSLYPYIQCVVYTNKKINLTDFSDFVRIRDAHNIIQDMRNTIQDEDFEWFQFINAGTEIVADSYLVAISNITSENDFYAIYTDKIVVDNNGEMESCFLPDFNIDYLLSTPAILSKGSFFHRDAFLKINDLPNLSVTSLEFEILIELIMMLGASRIGHIPEPVLIFRKDDLTPSNEESRIITNYLNFQGYHDGEVVKNQCGANRIIYNCSAELPKVSIVIIENNNINALQRCVTSLLERSKYYNYEILIVSCNTDNEEVIHWLNEIGSIDSQRMKVIKVKDKKGKSSLINISASEALGEYLLLLDATIFPVHDEWLQNLMNHGLRREVGCVGGKIIHLDETIYSAGLVLGINGVAESPFLNVRYDSPGYTLRLAVDQNYSAMSSEYLLIRKSIFQSVGGMSDTLTENYLSDIDLCLKVYAAGYLSVWTPYSIVATDRRIEQGFCKSEKISSQEMSIYEKWLPVIVSDPAYNKNLSLSKSYSLEKNIKPGLHLLHEKSLPSVVLLPELSDLASSYRLLAPFHEMKNFGMADGAVLSEKITVSEFYRYSPDVFITHYSHTLLNQLKRLKDFFAIYDARNLFNPCFFDKKNKKDGFTLLKEEFSVFNRIIVGSEIMAERYSKTHHDVKVLPTFLPMEWGNINLSENRQKKLRVGCITVDLKEEDLELIYEVIRDFSNEVTWVFLGYCPPQLKASVHELHRYQGLAQYPQQLASLNLDIAVAPLADNIFNRWRSNTRLLELGACGIPVICSNISSYQSNLPIKLVKNRYKDWCGAIREYINNHDDVRKTGMVFQDEIRAKWLLDRRNLEVIMNAWL
ncbi:glycosyltransferase [Pectobacterium jejuense]|uniref:glycosyltransferase n=1 Tax=Pectobacterium jejuense TaxID=2974022 RepID=UPI00227F8989|nr:glycosyltransferase [Pectobacterium jejuense]MCY9847738.1 glycosyltransferase [Pectobacterium jejuense]